MLGSNEFFGQPPTSMVKGSERHMFQAIPLQNGTWDIVDTRTSPPTFNQNQATYNGMIFAVVTLNGNLDGI